MSGRSSRSNRGRGRGRSRGIRSQGDSLTRLSPPYQMGRHVTPPRMPAAEAVISTPTSVQSRGSSTFSPSPFPTTAAFVGDVTQVQPGLLPLAMDFDGDTTMSLVEPSSLPYGLDQQAIVAEPYVKGVPDGTTFAPGREHLLSTKDPDLAKLLLLSETQNKLESGPIRVLFSEVMDQVYAKAHGDKAQMERLLRNYIRNVENPDLEEIVYSHPEEWKEYVLKDVITPEDNRHILRLAGHAEDYEDPNIPSTRSDIPPPGFGPAIHLSSKLGGPNRGGLKRKMRKTRRGLKRNRKNTRRR